MDDWEDIKEQVRHNKIVMEGECFDEIIQHLTWLMDEAAGGRGYKDYIQTNHTVGTRAYISDLEQALAIFMKYAEKAGKIKVESVPSQELEKAEVDYRIEEVW